MPVAATRSVTRRTVVTVVKIALAIAILSILIVQARDGFEFAVRNIRWAMLGAALACTFVAATLSFLRWHLLICAQGITIRLVDTLRLGALGLALNFVSPGSIGGDFFKAIFLAHGQPGRRTEAIATVVADRVLGLLTMLLLASAGILATDVTRTESIPLRVLCDAILLSTVVCWIGAGLLLAVPAFSGKRLRRLAERIPLAGRTIARLLGTVHVYRTQKKMLLAAFALSAVMALFFVTSFYLVARGLPNHEPSWSEHLVIVPVAGLVGAIPLTPSGVGTMEAAVKLLYQTMPGGELVNCDDGFFVAFGRRMTEVAVALVGFVFYLTHRRQVEEVYAEAEEAADMEE
jgi:uncharacterized protein (TIRG00374 family)